MKLLSRRAVVLLILLAAFLGGMVFFAGSFLKNASAWALAPENRHLYTNGQPNAGTISDRNGLVLAKTSGGRRTYSANAAIRTALMPTLGDSGGNVSTGVQLVIGKKLLGWNLLNGTYRFGGGAGNIRLTLDANLCAAAYQALAGRSGAVAVYNYKTGELLCMASSPSFDPENPPDVKADPAKYKGVYLNRALSAAYTPGSVFKLVTLAAALDTIPGVANRTYTCPGVLYTGGGKLVCEEAHGHITLPQALSDSCNITFGTLAMEMGAPTLARYAQKAGFGSSLEIDGIRTAPGHVDLSQAKGVNLGWAGVGQYTDTANPVSYMAYVGAIANGGVRVTPHLLAGETGARSRVLSASTAAAVASMMRNDTLVNYGDGRYPGLQLCAKSGTAQLSAGQAPNAWFVGFLNRSDCPLAFAVVIENGGSGSQAAGPVANTVLQAAMKALTAKK